MMTVADTASAQRFPISDGFRIRWLRSGDGVDAAFHHQGPEFA